MKQQITKNAIETAFVKLLNERNFEKVMVKDIVEECGLTRNTFYYYYEDTYNIVADILERDIQRVIRELDDGVSLEEATTDIFEFLDENHRIAKHLFTSGKKDDMYGYVKSATEIVMRHWVDVQLKNGEVSESDKRRMANICKFVVQGTLEEWIERGMGYSLKEELQQMRDLFNRTVWEVVAKQDK